jgi:hypothetical protein
MSSGASLARLVEIIKEDTIYTLSGPMPATVVSYDRDARRAALRFPVRVPVRDLDTGRVSYEGVGEVEDVPVLHLAGGGFSQTFDLEPGDSGLVIVLGSPVGEWLNTGEDDVVPGLDERFTLNGVVFLPGLSAFARSLPAEAGKMLWDGPLFQFGEAATHALARADRVAARLSALEDKFNDHTHSVPISVLSVPFAGSTTTIAPGLSDQVIPLTTEADVSCDKVLAE